jgi:hypothetical protein
VLDYELLSTMRRLEMKVDGLGLTMHAILIQQLALNRKETAIMATLQDIEGEVGNLDTVEDSAIALIQGLADQIKNLQPNQAAIDQLYADVIARKEKLAAAVTANTPAAPSAGDTTQAGSGSDTTQGGAGT